MVPAAGPYSWVSFDTVNSGLNLAPAASASVTVKASAAALAMGDYSALLAFGITGGEELLLPLVLTVSPPLQASPATVSESCALGTTTAATVTVTNRASTAVAWTASTTASWITTSPASGVSLAGLASVTVTLTLGAGLGTAATNLGSLALADDGVASEGAVSVELATRSVTGRSTVYRLTQYGIFSSWDGSVHRGITDLDESFGMGHYAS